MNRQLCLPRREKACRQWWISRYQSRSCSVERQVESLVCVKGFNSAVWSARNLWRGHSSFVKGEVGGNKHSSGGRGQRVACGIWKGGLKYTQFPSDSDVSYGYERVNLISVTTYSEIYRAELTDSVRGIGRSKEKERTTDYFQGTFLGDLSSFLVCGLELALVTEAPFNRGKMAPIISRNWDSPKVQERL